MNNSEFYKNAKINVDERWFHDITSSANDIVKELVETQNKSSSDQNADDGEDTDSDGFCERHDVGRECNCDTLLDDASRDMNQVYTFAPGEGQRPLRLYQDATAEYLIISNNIL